MAWSAENAIKAYLRTLKKVGNNATTWPLLFNRDASMEPAVAEFVSALAAGSGARLMVEACAGSAGATTLALIAAAHQTGGRVICVVPGLDELRSSEEFLGVEAEHVDLVVGDAREFILGEYRGSDFVLVDFGMEGHEGIFRAAQAGAAEDAGGVVVGNHALRSGAWVRGGGVGVHNTELLPIGDGLLVSRVPPGSKKSQWQWVVTVDECTGEEHVFRVASPRKRQWIEA